ncbi:hypothetical protein MRX96_054331 [Rhipicephalus microplus]
MEGIPCAQSKMARTLSERVPSVSGQPALQLSEDLFIFRLASCENHPRFSEKERAQPRTISDGLIANAKRVPRSGYIRHAPSAEPNVIHSTHEFRRCPEYAEQ